MLKIKKFVFNHFSENTFVLSNQLNNCIIIDPGCYHSHEEKELEEYITLNKLKIVSILQTHSHLDHMFGTSYIANKYNVPVAAVALQFGYANKLITSMILGMDRSEQVNKNILNFEYQIPSDLWKDLIKEKIIDERCPTH